VRDQTERQRDGNVWAAVESSRKGSRVTPTGSALRTRPQARISHRRAEAREARSFRRTGSVAGPALWLLAITRARRRVAPRSHYHFTGACAGAASSGCAWPLWLPRNALDHFARVFVLALQGDVGLRNHADEALILGRHG
jgi:hypothetical protein